MHALCMARSEQAGSILSPLVLPLNEQAMAGDALRDTRRAELQQLLMDRGIPFEPNDLDHLVQFGFYNALLLSAATKEDLEQCCMIP
jgi:hypothetical protein